MKYLLIFILILVLILNRKIENFRNFSTKLYHKCCKYFGCSNPICYNYLINNSPNNPLKRNVTRLNRLGSYPNKIYDNKYNYISPHILNSPNYLVLHKRFTNKNNWSYYVNNKNKLVKLSDYDNIKSEDIKFILYKNKRYYFN
jgi:hypothetical protein